MLLPALAQAETVPLYWSPKPGDYPPCSATISKACTTGFSIYQTAFVSLGGAPVTTRTKLATVPNPNLTHALVLLPSTLGTYTLAVSANYRDAAGALAETGDSNRLSLKFQRVYRVQ